MAKKYYGVRKGRILGVYSSWESCKAQVHKCANEYRSFDNYDEAAFYVATGQKCDGENSRALLAEWKRTQQQRRPSSDIVKTEEKPQIKVEAFDASQSYFSQVPGFKPDDEADFDDEFGRFASSQNIMPGSEAWRQNRTNAIRHEMIFHYSQKVDSDDEDVIKQEGKHDTGLSKEEKLQVFQNMCREVDLEPLDTIDSCVSNLKSVLVNIVDYINARRNGRPIKVWGPHEFEDFKRYTLSDKKRIDRRTATSGDGLLEPLLQFLRPKRAAHIYQDRRDRAAIAREDCASRVSGNAVVKVGKESTTTYEISGQGYEVISIHGTESDYSSSPQPIEEETVDTCPWSPSSIGSSVIEVLINSQSGTKRDLDNLMEGQDISPNEVTSTSAHKRLRT